MSSLLRRAAFPRGLVLRACQCSPRRPYLPTGERLSLVVWFSEDARALREGSAPWVQREAEAGNPEAQFVLGGFHYRGEEFGYGPHDLSRAVRWLAAAARQGNALAQVHFSGVS